jgi:hypothetical protein
MAGAAAQRGEQIAAASGFRGPENEVRRHLQRPFRRNGRRFGFGHFPLEVPYDGWSCGFGQIKHRHPTRRARRERIDEKPDQSGGQILAP